MASALPTQFRSAQLRRELVADNSHLHELLATIQQLLSHPSVAANHWSDLQSLFCEVCDQLAIHFALEETEGYLNISGDSHPEFFCAAEYLKHQHCELFEEMRSIADTAADVSDDHQRRIDAIVCRFHRFRCTLAAHEEAEWNLIQRSMEDDLGVGD